MDIVIDIQQGIIIDFSGLKLWIFCQRDFNILTDWEWAVITRVITSDWAIWFKSKSQSGISLKSMTTHIQGEKRNMIGLGNGGCSKCV